MYTPKLIVPGIYDVHYSWDATDTVTPPAIPRNQNARIRSEVLLTSSQVLNIDIPLITVSGMITVNGSVPPAERFGTVYLRNLATSDSVTLGVLSDAMYVPKQIVPGTYDVYYTWDAADTVTTPAIPRNQNVRIRSGLALTTSGALNIDIPLITVSGVVTVNGAVPPAERFGAVFLRNTATGDSVRLATVSDATYVPKQIVPGTYDVYYTWDAADTVTPPAIPRNLNARIRSGLVLNSTQTLNLDIPLITVTGTITVNGSVPPAERFGTVYLRNLTTGDSVNLGVLSDATYLPKQIVPGTYDVYYTWDAADTVTTPGIPRNLNARIRSGLVLTSSSALNIDIPLITISGVVTVNGAVPPAERFGAVFLRNLGTGDSVRLATVSDATYVPKQIVPGTYDVYYTWDAADTVMPPAIPRNQNARIMTGVALTSAQTLNINIPMITLNGTITVGGSVPMAERFGTVALRNTAIGDSVALGVLSDPTYLPKQIVPGTYDIYYTWNPADTVTPPALPRNLLANLGCVRILP